MATIRAASPSPSAIWRHRRLASRICREPRARAEREPVLGWLVATPQALVAAAPASPFSAAPIAASPAKASPARRPRQMPREEVICSYLGPVRIGFLDMHPSIYGFTGCRGLGHPRCYNITSQGLPMGVNGIPKAEEPPASYLAARWPEGSTKPLIRSLTAL